MFGYVKRERLNESEQFWRELLDRSHRTAERAIDHSSGYVDQLVELTRKIEQLKTEASSSEVTTGYAIGRSDNAVVIRVGNGEAFLSPREAQWLARRLWMLGSGSSDECKGTPLDYGCSS